MDAAPPPTDTSPALSTYRAQACFAVGVVFTVTSTVSVILRFVSKRLKRKPIGAEDYVIIVAQILVYAMATCVFLGVFIGGVGHPAGEIGMAKVTIFLKIIIPLQILYGSTLALIKTSICLFYIRIFSIRSFRIAAQATMGIIIAWGVMVVLTAFLLCRPLAYNWDPTIPGGTCANQDATFIAVGALDVVMDTLILILPLPTIWNLQIPRSNKIALSGIFGLGVFTIIISILRIRALLTISYADITNSAAYTLLWSFLEPAVGITVACGPIMRPLLEKILPNPTFFQKGTMRATKNSHGLSAFSRLDGEGGDAHSLSRLPPNSSVVTSSGHEEAAKTSDSEDDIEYGAGDGKPSCELKGITVTREFYTQRASM